MEREDIASNAVSYNAVVTECLARQRLAKWAKNLGHAYRGSRRRIIISIRPMRMDVSATKSTSLSSYGSKRRISCRWSSNSDFSSVRRSTCSGIITVRKHYLSHPIAFSRRVVCGAVLPMSSWGPPVPPSLSDVRRAWRLLCCCCWQPPLLGVVLDTQCLML